MKNEIIRLSKKSHEAFINTRPNLAGAFNYNGKQVITNGFWIMRYAKETMGVALADTSKGTFDINSQFLKLEIGTGEEVEIDINALREAIKRNEFDQKYYARQIKILNTYFSAYMLEYLLRTIKNPKFIVFENLKTLYFSNEKGDDGILMGLLKNKLYTDYRAIMEIK
jgi:hypothetical protein